MMYRRILILAAVAMATMVGAGCNEDNPPTGIRQRQDAALQDPFNYSPYDDRTDISGGGLMEFKKDAFKKDVNSVLSP